MYRLNKSYTHNTHNIAKHNTTKLQKNPNYRIEFKYFVPLKLLLQNKYCIFVKKSAMAMTIKTSPELWGEDARIFAEEAEKNGKLPTPKLSASQRKTLYTMLENAKKTIFPPK